MPRFMMLVQIDQDIAERYEPTAEEVGAMSKYNDELGKAGILLALDGLQPPDTGARVRFEGGKTTVVDGPYAEAKEIVGGYWVIQAKSLDEAVEWARRCPMTEGGSIEVRQVFEMSDFPADVQAAAGEPPRTAA